MTTDSTVTVRYFAAARAASGVDSEHFEATTTKQLREAMQQRHGQRLSTVLASCSILVDGTTAHHDEAHSLPRGATVDVLPPFAGG
ncbi:MAG TPA: MoaD/ThiS family protein [Candidatus Stackebrandtia faecavium]|nr:MoaD/ThiS family protein [Candidatus Stackebrandtia faecavium]